MSDISNVNDVEALMHLPVIEAAAEGAAAGRPQYWNDWIDHQTARRLLARAEHRDGGSIGCKVPVLGIAGWYDDARGTIRNYTVMSRLPEHRRSSRGDGSRARTRASTT